MVRRPEQVLVLPFRRSNVGLEFAIFCRSDRRPPCWQGIAGGLEDEETPEKAARRELAEEAGIVGPVRLIPLDSKASVPAFHFAARDEWGPDLYVVTEHSFGVETAPGAEIVLSTEHVEFRWLGYAEATETLEWDSNRTALWELNERLLREPPFPAT